MSDSESAGEYGSAKDDNYNGSGNSGGDSDSDAPLSKTKTTPKKKSTKSPKKKTVKKEKKGKKKAGRPAKKDKPAKVSFSLDPLAGAEPADEKDEEEEYEVEAIVGHREYNGKLVYKIRWKGYDAMHDTWESYESLSCPDLLEMYNTKHNVAIPSRLKKRKGGASGKSKRTPKKRRSSISDESAEEPWEGDGDSEDEYEVDKIVEMRLKKNGAREFLVHWKKWSSDYDTWEPEANLSCPEIIDRFLNRVENAKNANLKELRVGRKHTERFTLNTHDSGRRLSKRNNNKQRVSYYDAEGEDE